MTTYIAYRRTSTGSQNNGLEAQQNAINAFIEAQGGEIVESYVEQVSGRKNEREELNKAIKACKKHGATLLVSKLDRLSRRVSFIALLMESSISLKVCEHPDADTFMLHLRAILSEEEARLKSQNLIEKKKWPCYFFKSDTSGEKAFEEFYTNKESVFLDKFIDIGIVKNEINCDIMILNKFYKKINDMRNNLNWNKEQIIKEMKNLIPEFSHHERKKNLDEKM